MTKVSSLLKEIGFYQVQDGLKELQQFASELVLSCSRWGNPSFECHPSFIPLEAPLSKHHLSLVVDIGGTSTKAGVRIVPPGENEKWVFLFEIDNNDFFREDGSKSSFTIFLEVLTESLVEHLQRQGIDRQDIHSCGVVFSNSLQNKLLSDGRGITGLITCSSRYKKGEWFNRDVQDGDDIGQAFIDVLSERAFPINCLAITNDTPFTLKSLPNADGGMVASTGLNGTFVRRAAEIGLGDSDQQIVCNGEMGRGLIINRKFRSVADLIGEEQKADTVEYLSSGKFLPCLFSQYIITLADHGCGELSRLAEYLRNLGRARFDYYQTNHLSSLLRDPSEFYREQEKKDLLDQRSLAILTELAGAITSRSAKLCALVAYTTVSNRIEEQDNFLVALDSRLAREIPGFNETLTSQLKELTPDGKTITAVLIHPVVLENGIISVPMLGAANTLDCFL